MRMKTIISLMAFASVSVMTMAQSQLKSGIDGAYLDKNVSPKDDFFEFACGGWSKNNPLPNAYSRFGSFDKLQEDNNKRINAILSDLLKNVYPEGSTEQKLSDLYKLAMDSDRQNREGIAPIMPMINAVKKAKSVKELFDMQCKLTKYGTQLFFGAGLGADEKDSKNNVMNVVQGGITLHEKEYYLDNDSATVGIREAYKKYIVRLFKLAGFSEKEATQNMKYVLTVETALAKASKSQTELRDVEANYNKMSLSEMEKNYPHVQWTKYFNNIGVETKYIQQMVVGQPSFVKKADEVIANLPLSQYKAYMLWNIIDDASPYIGEKFSEANFDFFGKTLKGRKVDYPRWKKSVDIVQSMMGEALGKMYVERYFPASSKERMEKLVANLQASLKERINAQDWMSESTKANAIDKLNSFYVKIGYPNKWCDYSKLQVSTKYSYYENILRCCEFLTAKDIEERAGKPVDKDKWGMTPQTVNAYYNPTTNEICFPAGILQKPFFDPEADDAFNYGAIGVVIGHEMTHGFDDQGRHYDKTGNMKDWWTAEDASNFSARTKVLADFFSNINVLPDLKANGELTLGENLADHGGLQVSFNALKIAMKDSPLQVIDGFTPEQRFFLAYAAVWANNITEKEIRSRTKSDPHSLGRWRVNGSLPHVDAWYEAFNVESTDKMYIPKDKRLSLW
jgi:putative endopeptidase